MNFNISPEEILKQKEMAGGIKYDDRVIPQSPPQTGVQQEVVEKDQSQSVQPIQEPLKEGPSHVGSPNLGKASSQGIAFDTGWKNLPVSILPTGGDYYPEGTRIAIRAAEVREIRHFSTIDEEDRLDIEEKLSYVLERCSRMEFPGEGVVSYKDLKQEDRFFVIMAIRDLTFVRGENSIFLRPKKTCNQTLDCPFRDGIELRTGVLSSYRLDPQILKFYDRQARNFCFNIKKIGKKVDFWIPSIGVTQAISEFAISQERKGNPVDEGFLGIAPFLFGEWRDLDEITLLNKMREMDHWTKEEYSLAFELSEQIKIGTELEVRQQCPVCGGQEVTADITFPGGLRSLFVISDIFRELL